MKRPRRILRHVHYAAGYLVGILLLPVEMFFGFLNGVLRLYHRANRDR